MARNDTLILSMF